MERYNFWAIINNDFSPEKEKFYESIFSLANGYMGTRGAMEEAERSNVHQPATYIAGVFNKVRGETPDLVNVPNWLSLKFASSNEWLDINKDETLLFQRKLDMKNGLLSRKVRWEDKDGKITLIQITRFISQDNKHLSAIRYSVTPENYSGKIKFESSLDGNVTNNGIKHLRESEVDYQKNLICLSTRTKQSKIVIAEASKIIVGYGKGKIKIKSDYQKSKNKIMHGFEIEIERGRKYNIDKIISVHTSLDSKNPLPEAKKSICNSGGFDYLLKKHVKRWQKHWQESDIIIAGEKKLQKAIRFSVFHLIQLGQSNNGLSSIAAKGLSNIPGKGYRGHVFWDTENYILPFYIFTYPEIAKSLLMYRYRAMPRAKEKAGKNRCRGAMYPWESADTGEEATPKWVKIVNKKIRVWTGEKEHHISADIAYAVWQYFLATKDKEFIKSYGAEIILETARFWASRMSYNKKKKTYEIKGVIGPDEYHVKYPDKNRVGINNNFYTNTLAAWNIKTALKIIKTLPQSEKIRKKINLKDNELKDWDEKSQKIYIPFDKKMSVHPQFDGFMSLKYVDLKKFRNTPSIALETLLQNKSIDINATQITKQADVIMALYLLPDITDLKTKVADFDFYDKRTAHGSSLGGGIHIIMACRLKKMTYAYKHFVELAEIDLRDKKGNTFLGLHVAALGGIWQALINGFAGLRLKNGLLYFEPSLPSSWKGLEFKIKYRGKILKIRITKNSMLLKILGCPKTKSIEVEVRNKTYKVYGSREYKFKLR